LRHCATNGFDSRRCHWHNPSGRTMAQGSAQPLTEMSTRNISWGVKAAGVYGWQPFHLHVPIVLKSGSVNLLEPSGPVQACKGIVLPFTFFIVSSYLLSVFLLTPCLFEYFLFNLPWRSSFHFCVFLLSSLCGPFALHCHSSHKDRSVQVSILFALVLAWLPCLLVALSLRYCFRGHHGLIYFGHRATISVTAANSALSRHVQIFPPAAFSSFMLLLFLPLPFPSFCVC
jgi:hypothetical protein